MLEVYSPAYSASVTLTEGSHLFIKDSPVFFDSAKGLPWKRFWNLKEPNQA